MAEDMRIYDDLKDLVETEIEKIVKKMILTKSV